MPRNRIILASFIIFLNLFAEKIDEAIKYFESFQFEKAREIFNQLAKDESNPRIAEVYYYLARLSNNPDSSVFYFRKIIQKFPQSRYADIAYLEIAKSSIAKGEYKNATLTLTELLKNYPETELKEEIQFWLGVSYIESGSREEGIKILKELIRSYPKSVWTNRALSIIPDTVVHIEYYTVQVGSYRTLANATKCVEELRKNGLKARIVETAVKNDTFYRVWVGEFDSIEEAKALVAKLDSLGYKGNVVKGY